MASRVSRPVLTAALAAAALIAFAPKAAADPITYKTVTARQIQQASLSTRPAVPMAIIAGMYAAGYQGDPMTLAAQLHQWFNNSGGVQWTDAIADYHANSVRGVNNAADVAYARRVMDAATHVPHALAGAMSTGSALTLAAVVATASAAGSLGGLWDTLATGGAGAGTAGKVLSKAKGALSGGAKAAGNGLLKGAARAGTAAMILAGLGHAVTYLNGQLERELASGSTVGLAELRSGSFGQVYLVAAGISVVIALAMLVMAVAQAAVVGSGLAMARATLVELPKATIGALAAPVLVVLVGTALDGMATGLMHQAQGHVHQWFHDLGSGALAHVTEWVLAGIGNLILLTALLAAWVELALRKLLLGVILVFLPLAMAGEIHPRFRHWGPPLRRLIVALVMIKLLLALVVLLGSALPDMTNNWLLHLVGGGVILGIAAYAPYFFLRHAPMTAEATAGSSMSHRDDFSRHVGGPAALGSAGMAQWLADLRSSDHAARDDGQTGAGAAGTAGAGSGANGPGAGGQDGGDASDPTDTPAVSQPESRGGEEPVTAQQSPGQPNPGDGTGADEARRAESGRAGRRDGQTGASAADRREAAAERGPAGGQDAGTDGGDSGERRARPRSGAPQAPPEAGEVIRLREDLGVEPPAPGGQRHSPSAGDGNPADGSVIPPPPPEGSDRFDRDERGGGDE